MAHYSDVKVERQHQLATLERRRMALERTATDDGTRHTGAHSRVHLAAVHTQLRPAVMRAIAVGTLLLGIIGGATLI